ncbi:hypothetical protein [Hyalangium minutum]|uniref:hypothetical protein n=1 Tax=Hyalangium minutum TaxID=394096 RepID=UPI0005C5194C|nr:hypothetical protein [Hyalangium minutum]
MVPTSRKRRFTVPTGWQQPLATSPITAEPTETDRRTHLQPPEVPQERLAPAQLRVKQGTTEQLCT